MNHNCSICNKNIGNLMVGTGNNTFAHSECYERQHPPFVAKTLMQVARGSGDPVLAAQVITETILFECPDLADKIVDEFNQRLLKNWLRRLGLKEL